MFFPQIRYKQSFVSSWVANHDMTYHDKQSMHSLPQKQFPYDTVRSSKSRLISTMEACLLPYALLIIGLFVCSRGKSHFSILV